jgi:hypothetical protein
LAWWLVQLVAVFANGVTVAAVVAAIKRKWFDQPGRQASLILWRCQ